MKITKKIATVFIFVSAPFLMVALMAFCTGTNIFHNRPVYSDELLYWRELFSIAERGTSFGYTEGWLGVDYAPTFWTLGCHGLSPVLAWGWYAVLFGIKDNSLMLAGVIMLAVSLGGMSALLKPTGIQVAGLMGLLFSYVPLVTLLPTSMMELPCYAAVVVVIALLVYYERHPLKAVLLCLIIAIVYCSMLRITYAVFFLPMLFLIYEKSHSRKKFVCGGGLVLLGTGGLYILQDLFISKWPYDFFYGFRKNYGEASNIRIILHNGKYNLINWLNPYSDDWQQAMQRYLVLIVLLVLLIKWMLSKKTEYLGMLLALGSLWAALIAIYDVFDWRDYRTDAPVVFGILMWLLLKADMSIKHSRILSGILIAGYALCMVPFLVSSYTVIRNEERFEDVAEFEFDWENVLDNNGEPCTIGMYETDNWNYAFIKSLPPEVGYSIIGYEVELTELETADYIVTDIANREVPENYTWVADINSEQQLWKFNRATN
jgi:hypothetical protein